MKIERTSKEKREKNALYLMHSNSNMIALVVDRVSSSSLNRVRLIANIYKSASYPEVVGESVSDGVMGAFYEFLGLYSTQEYHRRADSSMEIDRSPQSNITAEAFA